MSMLNQKKNNIRLNAILNSIRSIMSIIFPMITYPYVTRILMAENLGKVNFASSTLSYFSLIAVLGLTSYAAREGAGFRDDKKKLNNFCAELLSLNLCTTVFAYIIFGIALVMLPSLHSYTALLAIYSVTIIFSTLGMEWVYTIYEDYLYITLRSIAMQILSLILMFIFVRDINDFYWYAAINVIASVGGNIFNFIHVRKYISLKLKFNKNIFNHLKYSIVFFASSIASSIYSNIGNTILGLMSGDIAVGLLAVAMKIYVMIKSLIIAVLNVTTARLAYYKYNNMQDEYNHTVSKLIKTIIVLLFPVVVGINLVAEEVILIVAGSGFMQSVSALRYLSIAILWSIFASIAGCILITSKQEKKVLFGTICAAITNVVVNLFCIPFMKQDGAALAVVVAEFVVLLINGRQCKGLIKLEKIGNVILSGFVACIAMSVFCLIIEKSITIFVFKLLLKVIGGGLVYVVFLIIGKNEITIEYIEILKRKFI